ncbi:T-cell receptor beta chain V region 3H.25 [Cricetulus griseus]|nr:T-cell receptor beta chain V region 3H.25 [Cricetulus griseus]
MGAWLICCVALCLLQADFVDAAVTQTPSHLIKTEGQRATMKCNPEKGQTVVYWYQQRQNKELKFLIYFQGQQPIDQIDMVKKRFSAECPSNSPCSLEINISEVGDSALYFCASSQSTALKCPFPSVHKPTMEPA